MTSGFFATMAAASARTRSLVLPTSGVQIRGVSPPSTRPRISTTLDDFIKDSIASSMIGMLRLHPHRGSDESPRVPITAPARRRNSGPPGIVSPTGGALVDERQPSPRYRPGTAAGAPGLATFAVALRTPG